VDEVDAPPGFGSTDEVDVLGVSENPDKIPEHVKEREINTFKRCDDARGGRESPTDCSSFQSCESPTRALTPPFYRETKGLLHPDYTLELKEYS
jgi:hypothetical protein